MWERRERGVCAMSNPNRRILPGFRNAKQTGHPQGDQASGSAARRRGAVSGLSPQTIRAEGKGLEDYRTLERADSLAKAIRVADSFGVRVWSRSTSSAVRN